MPYPIRKMLSSDLSCLNQRPIESEIIRLNTWFKNHHMSEYAKDAYWPNIVSLFRVTSKASCDLSSDFNVKIYVPIMHSFLLLVFPHVVFYETCLFLSFEYCSHNIHFVLWLSSLFKTMKKNLNEKELCFLTHGKWKYCLVTCITLFLLLQYYELTFFAHSKIKYSNSSWCVYK